MLNILQLLNTLLENSKQLTARKVAAVVGKIIALSPVLGNICRIMTRHLHHAINERTSWDSFVQIDDFSIKELQFSIHSLKSLPNCVLAPIQRLPERLAFTDASSYAGADYVVHFSDNIVHRMLQLKKSN